MLPVLFFLMVLIQFSKSDYNYDDIIRKIPTDDSSTSCFRDYGRLSKMSRIRMFDSSSKILHGGFLQGNFVDLGFYDECVSIAEDGEKIYGKYCLMTIPMRQFKQIIANNNSSTQQNFNGKLRGNNAMSQLSNDPTFGICIPDSCTPIDIKMILPLVMNEEKCYTKLTNSRMNTGAVITIVIIYVFIVIAIVSTIYDCVIERRGEEPKHPIFISFSLYTNGKKLLKKSTNSSQIDCLAGIKVFSMMWVILGHTFISMMMVALDNFADINPWIDDPRNMIIMGATVTVDTFFTIGGLLASYVFMMSPSMKVKDGFKTVPMLYAHRYIRLTPAFAMMILIYGSGIIKYLGDGPNWNILNMHIENCQNYWWMALLYIHNYSPSKMCIGQSWYLATDFQLFLITPLILIPLRKWPRYVLPILYILAAIGIVIPFCMGYTNENSGVGLAMGTNFFVNEYYFRTYVRFGPYIIGMIMGFYIYQLKSEQKLLNLKTKTTIFLWVFSVSALLFCIFDGYKLVRNDQSKWWDGTYMGFNRSVWSIAISIVILLCYTGNGVFINNFLSLHLFQIVAKLSYSMYLVHFLIIIIMFASMRTPLHFSNFTVFSQFFTVVILTLFISIFYVLLFESPMIMLEKIIFKPKWKNESK